MSANYNVQEDHLQYFKWLTIRLRACDFYAVIVDDISAV